MQNLENLDKQIIYYPSFTNDPQLDFNVLPNDAVVTLDDTTMSTMTSLTLSAPHSMNNGNQFNYLHASEAITPNNALQQIQDYQILAYSQTTATAVISKCSFFYAPCNDFQMYHIICEEIPLSSELVSALINNTDNNLNQSVNNTYVFYYEQHETKKIYKITCEMVSHTFIFQFLNKVIYGIQFAQIEYQRQEFSKKHQENLKFHLKKDLIHYLASKQVYEQRYNLFNEFFQDYVTYYEDMINSNVDILNHSQQCNTNFLPPDQPSTSQQDNNYGFQNCIIDNYNQSHYDDNFFQH